MVDAEDSRYVRSESWRGGIVVVVSDTGIGGGRSWPMKEYINIWKATIAEYITNHSIYEMCTGAERMPGYIRIMRWWGQGLNLEEKGKNAREGAERDVERHRENYSVTELCICSSLTTCRKGGALIHIP